MRKNSLFRTSVLALSLVTVLGMTACGNKNTSDNANTDTETKAVVSETVKQTEKTTENTTKAAESIPETEAGKEYETTAEGSLVTDENGKAVEVTTPATEAPAEEVIVADNSDAGASDNNNNNGGNSAGNDNNSSDTPTQQPDVPDTPSYEPEPTPEPTPEPEPEPAEPEVNYIPCKSYFDNRDLTEIWAITWDTITPTSNKYIYYRIRIGEKGGIIYQYFFFNESIDTAVMLAETYNSDVEQQTKIYVDSFDNTLPYLVY